MTSPRLTLVLTLACLPILAQSPTINIFPSREFGHTKLTLGSQTGAPNLVEGRELQGPTAIAFDTTVNPPIVYVADTGNHRVLAWNNPANLSKGNPADKVIGQRDLVSSFPGGPGSTSGLTAGGMGLPNGLAVDSAGSLYVLDAGNNRVLRFPRPMQQQGDFVAPDMVIGQKTPSSGVQSNQGLPKPTDKTLSFNRGGGVSRGALAFDAQGNLWVADTLNNRVLRFPKANLTRSEPAADLVLGHFSFDNDDAATQSIQTDLMVRPTGLAIDERGGVYVTDGGLRALYYDAPATGVSAKRLLGLPAAPLPGQPSRPAPNDYTLGRIGNEGSNPQCVFMLGLVPFFCDNAANRIVRYGSPDSWPAITTEILSPPITAFYGQNQVTDGGINRGAGISRAGATTFYGPGGGAFLNDELWIADTGNNRVVAYASTGAFAYPAATKVLGQLDFDLNAPNLVDGRELNISSQSYRGSAIAVDRRSTPNRLYIADSLNNRILAFRDIRTVGTDSRTALTKTADLVIGQPDLFRTGANFPQNDILNPTDQGLLIPSGVAVDAFGNLWVADTGNSRILRFADPFAQPAGEAPHANLVLGQFNFSVKITDASSSNMSAPTGVAVFNNGDVAASDFVHNRVLLFRKSGVDFTNGQGARAVLGQQNFFGTAPGSSANGLNQPRGLAVDSSDRLYVADSANGRVIVYSSTGSTTNGATGTSIPNINSPEGVAINQNTGELWVASYGANAVYRFLEFSQLGANPSATAAVSAAGPMGIALDAFDNVIAAEAANRMTFFYARAAYQHAATYASGSNLGTTLTPGMYTILYRLGKLNEFEPASAVPPYPKTLGGYQVLVNGVAAPITSMTANAIYFLVPNNAPSSGEVEYLVTRPATGEIVMAGTFIMGVAAPGFFTANQQGTLQIAATHASDGSANSATNRIGQDEVITLWLTGMGHLDNAPPDGEAAGRAIETAIKPTIFIGGAYRVPDDKILYSGVSPEFPGLWQINIRMPKNGEPGAPAPHDKVSIIVRMIDVASNIGGTNTAGVDRQLQATGPGLNGLVTTIAIK